MNSEQLLINKWRNLDTLQQQEVLDFVDRIAQKSLKENQYKARVQQIGDWIDWTADNADDSPGLPDEALSRDSIYEDRS